MRLVLFDFGGLVLIVFRLGWLLWVILLCWLVCGLWGVLVCCFRCCWFGVYLTTVYLPDLWWLVRLFCTWFWFGCCRFVIFALGGSCLLLGGFDYLVWVLF